MNIAIIFAGGSGMRMGADVPKQFLEINGLPVLAHTLRLFQSHPEIDAMYLVCNPDFRERSEQIVRQYGIAKIRKIVDGGASAQDSIYNGITAVAKDYPSDSIVLLHDGVRPCVDADVISANIKSVKEHGNAVTYTPCVETLVISKDGQSISEIPYRRESYAAQAPQSFRLGDIIAAHEKIRASDGGYTDMVDQATICWKLGIPIHLVPGNRGNIKITTPEDVFAMRALLQYREDIRNGLKLAEN